MYKKILSASLLATTVMFSACGNNDTTCRIDVQKAIDEGRYDNAISDLKGRCASAYNTSDLNMNLAAAYMGKSGYSVSDIINMVIDSGDNGNNNAFTSFLTSVDQKKNANSLPLLTTASQYYVKAIERGNVTQASVLCSAANLQVIDDPRLDNACLYIGFNETIKAANTITYLTGDVNTLVNSIDNNNSSTPYDMRASLDALGWAMNPNYPLQADTNISASSVTFSNGRTFADINVTYTVNNQQKVFLRLANSMTQDINNTTVITDGYCDVNGSRENCQGMEDNTTGEIINPIAGCYACPVIMDTNNTLSVTQLLVDTINNGTDTISAVSGDQSVTNAVNDFKQEIINARTNGDTSTTITVNDIINYLQQ